MQGKTDDIEQPLIDEKGLSGNVTSFGSLQRPGSLQRRRWFQRPYAEASPPQAAVRDRYRRSAAADAQPSHILLLLLLGYLVCTDDVVEYVGARLNSSHQGTDL